MSDTPNSLRPFNVGYINYDDGPFVQEFICQAENHQHAEEQCLNAYPGVNVVWIDWDD